MYCKKCGTYIDPSMRYCPKCKMDLEYSSEDKKQKQSTKQSSGRHKNKMIIISALAVSFIALIGIGIGLGLLINYLNLEKENEVINKQEQEQDHDHDNDNEQEIDQQEQTDQDIYAHLIRSLNDGTLQKEQIDLAEENYEPALQNKEAVWDRSLFYMLEDIDPSNNADGQINTYNLQKKCLINSKTNNKIEYEIYSHPMARKVNKIVSIENKGEYLEIVEYYYTDDGKVSFIFKKKDINYIPSYATPDKEGDRYYFNNDTLVKWRAVVRGGQSNYIVGKNEKERVRNNGSTLLFDELSINEQNTFLQREKEMINAAYNTYDTVLAAEGTSEIKGYVVDEEGRPLEAATIALHFKDDERELYTCETDSSGYYEITMPPADKDYQLSIKKRGYVDTTIYDIHVDDQLVTAYQETVYLVSKKEEQIYHINLTVCDALNVYEDGMLPLSNADIVIRKGINNKTGEILLSERADSNGKIKLKLEPGSYTVALKKAGYIDSFYTLIARYDNEEIEMNSSPTLSTDEIRIVLTWGSFPQDLDAHLFTPYSQASEDKTYHIWYGNLNDINENNLDVDDTNAYGPETMTIHHLGDGLYKYYVADYTNCSQDNLYSYDMSLSNARVSVYSEAGLLQTFYVPSSRPGVIWEVFEIRNKKIIPLQRYYEHIEDKTWWNNEK